MLKLNERVEDITTTLVRIPSVTTHEKEITDVIESAITPLYGFQTKRVENNLISKVEITNANETLLIAGHSDTVLKHRNQREGGFEDLLYGRGYVDMKGGLGCMLKLMYEISRGFVKPKYNIIFAFYAGEEGPIKTNGMKTLIEQGHLKGADFGYILEPTNGNYGVGCLGRIIADIHIKGRSAHTASPWEGVNAIVRANPIQTRIIKKSQENRFLANQYNQIDYRESLSLIQPPHLTFSNNTIPDLSIISVDYRFAPYKKLEDAEKELIKMIGYLDKGFDDKIKFGEKMISSFVDITQSPFVFKGIKREILQGWSDIAQLNQYGIPSINYGPGSIKSAHSKDEYISISELNQFYKDFVRHIEPR